MLAYFTHEEGLQHDTGLGHPECPDRLRAINDALAAPRFSNLPRPSVAWEEAHILTLIELVHPPAYHRALRAALPSSGHYYLDNDTVLSPGSWRAALSAVALACAAVDHVMQGKTPRAFCAIRPPGHHAEAQRAMGFCLFNHVAIAANYARKQYGLTRIAIVDFDVHHGNGTQSIFYTEPAVCYLSTHEMPLYPGTGYANETGVGNIVNIPLAPHTDGAAYRKLIELKLLPALERFAPQLLLLSAGFDAHRDDPLATVELLEDDYRWLTTALCEVARQPAQGRIVSLLEGGYHLPALARSVATHLDVLANTP